MPTSTYLVILLYLCILPSDQALVAPSKCDKSRLGDTYCIKFDSYSSYQYGTCVTGLYVQQQTNGLHWCPDDYENQCYHPCMLEVYSKRRNYGAVHGVCSCNASIPIVQSSSLPPTCFSPVGSTCGWYTDCLEKRIPCGGESGYAVAFAQKFCEIYNTKKFSPVAQKWVNDVRMCLQMELVPLLRPYVQLTCDILKQTAFGSHTPCYLRPYQGAPSICQLPIKDLVKILMAVKGAVVHETYKTMSNAFKVSSGCTKNLLLESYQRVFGVVINIHRGENRKRRSTSEERILMASQFLQAMADRFKWNDANIDFLLVAIDKIRTIRFKFILSDRTAYDNVKSAGNKTQFTNEIMKMQRAIQDGDVAFRIGGVHETYYISSLSECVDANCNSFLYSMIGKDASITGKPKSDPILSNNVIVMIGMAVVAFVVVVIIAAVVVGWATSTAVSLVAYKMQ